MSDPEQLQGALIELAQPIDRHLNPAGGRAIGFIICAFEFGSAGAPLAYVSNADPQSLGPALVELIGRLATSGVVTLPRQEGA